MTNYEKVKAYIEAGHKIDVYDNDNKTSETFTRHDIYNKESLNALNLTLTPIPQLRKEIKGRVQIIDCLEIREMVKEENWCDEKIKMIGKTGLDIKYYHDDNDGQSYNIYLEDKLNDYRFPAQFVAPSFEEDKTEEMTLEEVCKELGKDIKIIK